MANRPIARALAAAGAALIVGGAAVGVVWAQQTPTPTRPPGPSTTPPAAAPSQREQQFLDAVAAKLGVSADRLRQAIADARKDLGLPPGGGFGPFGGRFGRGGFGFGGSLDAAAKAIGISVDQLRQELPGKSLTDVARAHNVNPTTVADALKKDAAARIDQAVANGRLTADRATQLKQDANTRIDQLMTRQLPAGGPGFRGKPGGPGAPGASPTPGAQRPAAIPSGGATVGSRV